MTDVREKKSSKRKREDAGAEVSIATSTAPGLNVGTAHNMPISSPAAGSSGMTTATATAPQTPTPASGGTKKKTVKTGQRDVEKQVKPKKTPGVKKGVTGDTATIGGAGTASKAAKAHEAPEAAEAGPSTPTLNRQSQPSFSSSSFHFTPTSHTTPLAPHAHGHSHSHPQPHNHQNTPSSTPSSPFSTSPHHPNYILSGAVNPDTGRPWTQEEKKVVRRARKNAIKRAKKGGTVTGASADSVGAVRLGADGFAGNIAHANHVNTPVSLAVQAAAGPSVPAQTGETGPGQQYNGKGKKREIGPMHAQAPLSGTWDGEIGIKMRGGDKTWWRGLGEIGLAIQLWKGK